MIRISQNGFTRDGQRLNNGDLKQVKGFTSDGDIRLVNGWVVSKDYGNLTHGYCVTSYGSQSKRVDCVFVAESSESFRAADREQFYVSASRFKEALTIYTDDKEELLSAIFKTSERPSATDLMNQQSRKTTRESDFQTRVANTEFVEKGARESDTDSQAQGRSTFHFRRDYLVNRRFQQSRSKGITT